MVTNPCSFKTELLGSTAMACTSHVGMTSQLAVFEQIRPRRTTLMRLTHHQLQSPGSGIPPMRVPERVSHGSTSVSASKGIMVQEEECEKQEVQEVAGGGKSFRFMAEGNMWLLEFQASGLRVLADPWLVDDQTFWDQPWLYTGRSQSRLKGGLPGDLTMESVNSVDAILICQDYEDHCHLPTLKLLRKDIPVIASPKAARIVQGLGFSDVRSLGHGKCTEMAGGLQVWATVGARVGPPWSPRENGFVLQDLQSGLRFYYEPHCSFGEESIRSVSPVDVVITPGRQYKVAGFPLTESVEEAVRLLRILQPQLVIPIQLTHLETTGVAAPLLQLIGSENDFEADLRKAGIKARLAVPPLSGHFMHVQLGSEKQAF